MALSIKNRKAEELANTVIKETGETITQAVITSLEERLERLRGRRQVPNRLEEIMEISRKCRELPDLDRRSPEEILGYDGKGVFE